jgi:hypothetical protein
VKQNTASGNPEVVAMLKTWLKEARRGQINYCGLFVVQKPNQVACDFAGAVEMEQCTPAGIEGLKAKIGQSIRDRQPPPRDLTLGADYVCYRPYQQPSNFDFTSWLVQREMERAREGAPAPLRVAFWSPPGLDFKRKMLDPVVRAMVPLLGAIEDDAAKHGRLAPLDAGYANIVTAARAGEEVPKFTAPGAARTAVRDFLGYNPPVVTITLRETEHDLSRNSDTSAWLALARRIQSDGYRVIFVRDTARAKEPLGGFETMSTASLMLDIRLALYEFAKLNFFVSNGPVSLAFFSDVPWRAFIAVSEDNPLSVSTPTWWQHHHGILPGEQFPWSGPDQRIVWARDNYENIVSAWDGFLSVRCDQGKGQIYALPH